MEADTLSIARNEQVRRAEAQLRQAMETSDVDLLDQLMAPELIFTNHTGQILGKEDDLQAHRTGLIRIAAVSVMDQEIRLIGDAAVVSVKMNIQGVYDNHPASGIFHFTRVWHCQPDNRWQLVAGHSSLLSGPQ